MLRWSEVSKHVDIRITPKLNKASYSVDPPYSVLPPLPSGVYNVTS